MVLKPKRYSCEGNLFPITRIQPVGPDKQDDIEAISNWLDLKITDISDRGRRHIKAKGEDGYEEEKEDGRNCKKINMYSGNIVKSENPQHPLNSPSNYYMKMTKDDWDYCKHIRLLSKLF